MIRNRRPIKDARKRILRQAEDKVTKQDYEQSDEITRIGIVWAGLLDLDDVLPSTTVAAMMAAANLVRATSTTDAEEYWIDAAALEKLATPLAKNGYGQYLLNLLK